MQKAFYYPTTSVETCAHKIPIVYQNAKPTSLGTYYENINDQIGYRFKEEIEPSCTVDKVKIIYNKNPSQCVYRTDISSYDDSRLIDPIRYQKLCLDRLPDQLETLSFEDMYVSNKLTNYGKNYTGYDDITGGQIKYWRWDTKGSSLMKPVFSTSAISIGNVYIDPMDNIKPEYIRKPLVHRDIMKPNNLGNLSSIIDTNEAREALMASYISKMDRSQFQTRWT